jgi:hypothetical protein
MRAAFILIALARVDRMLQALCRQPKAICMVFGR